MITPSYYKYNQEVEDGLTSSYMDINITNTKLMNGRDYILLVYYSFDGNEPIPLYPYGIIKMNYY